MACRASKRDAPAALTADGVAGASVLGIGADWHEAATAGEAWQVAGETRRVAGPLAADAFDTEAAETVCGLRARLASERDAPAEPVADLGARAAVIGIVSAADLDTEAARGRKGAGLTGAVAVGPAAHPS